MAIHLFKQKKYQSYGHSTFQAPTSLKSNNLFQNIYKIINKCHITLKSTSVQT